MLRRSRDLLNTVITVRFNQFSPIVFVALALSLISGCATPPRSVDAGGAMRRTVPELAELRPAAMNAVLTSQAGERVVYRSEERRVGKECCG